MKGLFRKKSLSDFLPGGAEDHMLTGLNRTLTVWDLTAFGIAAIIGAGIFTTIGNAAADGGPAVSILFIFTAVACGFSALCYAEFASMAPISGSAYTYAYYSFGELIAWIIGWDLLLEYAIGNIAVAISWSEYLVSFLHGFGLKIPEYLCIDYWTALQDNLEVQHLMSQGKALTELPDYVMEGYRAWNTAPLLGSVRIIANIPAFLIVVVITMITYVGIKESRTANNFMVLIKLLVVIAVITIGVFYVQPENWVPFAPKGVGGVLRGVSAVFFAYIGFDAISTTAEETKNPQRDLPRAIFYSLIICTVLYVLISLVITGMVNYSELQVGDPLSYVFAKVGLTWISGIVAFTALIAMASVLLIFQLGQPRIWMSMSRDGLLPKIFARIHPKFKTPSFSTIITGLVVGIPALFLNLTVVTDLTSIGTLFAFVIVSGGLLLIDHKQELPKGSFRVPYVNGRYIIPAVVVIALLVVYEFNQYFWSDFFAGGTHEFFINLHEKLPMIIFLIALIIITVLCITKKLSVIPVLGLLSCLFLMTGLGYINWLRFIIWLAVGLAIYFLYGRKRSLLNRKYNPNKISE